jgi:signal peptidase I
VTRRPALGCLLEIVETLVLTLVIFVAVQAFIAQPYRVKQESMEHTLEPGDYVLVDKLTPRFGDYGRGDVIVFDAPSSFPEDEDGTPLIKRVVALAGDSVEVRADGFVYVNDTRIAESYLYENQPTHVSSGEGRWTVPIGDLFVLGDHRQLSANSRVFGPTARSSVTGRAWLRYWPLGGFGVLAAPATTNPGIGP